MSRASNQRTMPHRTRKGEARDLLLYILAGVGAVCTVTVIAVFTKVQFDPLFKWLGFGIVTALVFGDTIRANRRHWKSRRFWWLLAVFFAVQCAIGIPVLWAATKVPAIYWGAILPLNYGVLAGYLALLLHSRRA